MKRERYDELCGEWYELSNVLDYQEREAMRQLLFDLSNGGMNQLKSSVQVAQITEEQERELEGLEEKGVERILDNGGRI